MENNACIKNKCRVLKATVNKDFFYLNFQNFKSSTNFKACGIVNVSNLKSRENRDFSIELFYTSDFLRDGNILQHALPYIYFMVVN